MRNVRRAVAKGIGINAIPVDPVVRSYLRPITALEADSEVAS
jgi:hypothetical protein